MSKSSASWVREIKSDVLGRAKTVGFVNTDSYKCMKTKTSELKHHPFKSHQLLCSLSKQALLFGAALALVGGAATVQAASIVKANNTDNLDLGSSWVGGVVPGAADMGVWNSTVAGANATVLGNNLMWSGIQVLNPGGAVTIGATTTNANAGATLTLGTGGIDMSSASQSLTLAAPVTLATNALQSWSVGNGQTLALTGPFTRSRTSYAQLRFDTSSGTINIPISSLSGEIVGGATNSALYFSLLNGTDVGDVDSSGDVAPAATVMNSDGLYYQNTAGGDPLSSSLGGEYLDMVNGNSSGDDVDLGGVRYIGFVRFNTPNPYKNNWVFNAGTEANETADPGSTYLMTTNVGAQDVIIEGSANVFRWNDHIGNDELILDQEDTAGTMYINGTASQRTGNGVITKTGAGRAVWNANMPITGPINVLGGEFMLNSPSQASSVITVGNGATLSGATTIPGTVTVNGGAIHPGSTNGLGTISIGGGLTLNAGSTLTFYSATSPMNNTSALLNVTGGLTVNGPVTVSIIAGFASVGQFPLVHWTNAISSATFADFSAAFASVRTVGGYLTNDTANQTIDLVVTNVDEPIKWAVGNGTWDTQTANWVDQLGASTKYVETNESGIALSDSVLFDDTASGTSPITVTLNNHLMPASTTVNNASKEYVFTGAGDIGGFGMLTKSGSGTLLLESSNSFSGGININGGIVSFSALPQLGAGGINFGGGTLQFASGNTADISARSVTFNAGGGTVDNGGNTLSFANPIGNGGAGGFTKTGAGTLTLNGTNDYDGDTVVNQGTLALGAGTILPDSAAIVVNSGATLDVATSGVGLTLNGSANQMLGGVGTVAGSVTAPTSTTISPATNGVAGTLTINGALTVNGATLAMDISGSSKDLISVSGNLTLNNGTVQLNVSGTLTPGTYTLIQYSGTLSGAAGNLALNGFSQTGEAAYLDDSVAGQINLVVSSAANDNLTWSGSGSSWDLNSTLDWLKGSTPWAFTNGDTVTFNDSASGNSTVGLNGSLQPTLVTVNNSTIPTYTFADNGGKISGSAALVKEGTGTLVVETANTYTGPTTVNGGTLQIGNGAGGDIGKGAVTNNGALVFEQGDGTNHFVDGVVSGTGSVTENGNATVILTQDNTYSGPTTVSAGTLQVGNGGATGSLGSDAAVTDNGTLAIDKSGASSFAYNVSGSGALVNSGPGALSLTGSLTYQGNTTINAGVVKIGANNQLPSTATVAGSTGSLNLNGGASAGVLDLAGFNQTVNALSGASGTVNGLITNSAASGTNTLTVLDASATTYNGAIADAGDGAIQLVALGTNTLTLNGTNNYSGGTALGAGASVTIGTIESLGTGTISLSNNTTLGSTAKSYYFATPITTAPGATAVIAVGSNVGYNGGFNNPFSGGSTATNEFVGESSWHADGMLDNFYGTVLLTGDPSANGVRIYNPTIGTTNVTLDLQGGDFFLRDTGDIGTFGALTGDSAGEINSGGTFIIGGKGVDTSYGGTIEGALSFVKDGTGTLLLNGGGQYTTNTITGPSGFPETIIGYGANMVLYTGSTTVSNGVLKLSVPSLLTNSPSITLAAPTAVLDASDMGYITNEVTTDEYGDMITNQTPVTNSLFEVISGQTLQGIGTLRGGLMADANSRVAVGLPTGSLTVTSNVELAGTVTMNVNASGAPNSSELIAPGFTIDSTAALVVTNIGPEAAAKFQLFNHPVNFSSVTLPALTGTNSWIDNLATDGSITLVAPSLPPPTPTITGVSLSGTTLSLTATNGAVNGQFVLLESTNVATPLTNWVPVLTNTFDVNGNLNLSTNIVKPGVPREFYILSQ
jgi:fibronectin-binding autotransporter adhesin